MKSKLLVVALVASFAGVGTAQTFDVDFDVTGVPSYGGYGDAGNTVWLNDVSTLPGALPTVDFYTIVGVAFDVSVSAFDPSWLSEILMAFENSTVTDWYDMQVAPGANAPGSGAYSSGGMIDLVGGDEVVLNADHIMRNEFWEGFDDSSVAPDGNWDQGIVTVRFLANPVPEPATMVALGLGAAAMLRRRRSK